MEVIKTSKSKKATGVDRINMELLIYENLLIHLRKLYLIDQCWFETKISEMWQTAQIISLFEKDDFNNCENYAGVSLLNALYKITQKSVTMY